MYVVQCELYISGNFYFSFVSTSPAYPKTKEKQKVPEVKTTYNMYMYTACFDKHYCYSDFVTSSSCVPDA